MQEGLDSLPLFLSCDGFCRVNLNKEHEEILLSFAERRFESDKLLADICSFFSVSKACLSHSQVLSKFYISHTLFNTAMLSKSKYFTIIFEVYSYYFFFSIMEMSVYIEKKIIIHSQQKRY